MPSSLCQLHFYKEERFRLQPAKLSAPTFDDPQQTTSRQSIRNTGCPARVGGPETTFRNGQEKLAVAHSEGIGMN